MPEGHSDEPAENPDSSQWVVGRNFGEYLSSKVSLSRQMQVAIVNAVSNARTLPASMLEASLVQLRQERASDKHFAKSERSVPVFSSLSLAT